MNIDTAKELKQSLMWFAVVEEMDKKIHYELQKLKTCTPADLGLIQAKIVCYESIKTLPDDVIERDN
jgi:hypothetical protein